MTKKLGIFIISLLLFGCDFSDDNKQTFGAFTKEVKQCESNKGPSCQSVRDKFSQVAPLIRKQHYSPQAFGSALIDLQRKAVRTTGAEQAKINDSIRLYYQVIRWFESPQ